MAKNVMKLLKPSPHRARNDFDLSHRHVFDANFGELLPATCIETVPGDNITLHASDLLRAIPFVNSPFLRAKQHLDVWFVPYHDLWHQFDAFITQKSEPVSAAFKAASYLPHTTQYALYNAIHTGSGSIYNQKDIIGRALTDRSYYLLELLGYGDIANAHGSLSDTFKVNPFRLAAYNYIWYNEYRQQYYDDGSRLLQSGANVASLFNFDDLSCDTVANALITDTSAFNTRLAAMSQMRYRCWKKDLFTGVLPNTQFGAVSTVPLNITGSGSGSATVSGMNFSINPILNERYGRYEGFTDFDEALATDGQQSGNLNYNGNTPESPLYFDSAYGIGADADHVDALTSSDTQVGEPIYQGLGPRGSFVPNGVDEGPSTNYRIYHRHRIIYPELASHLSVGSTGSATISNLGLSVNGNFDILALRKSEAIQIWRENALRAGNHIKDNMMAHYGVASDFNDHRPTYLGSVSAPLNIGDIATTANASSGVNDTVGDIAGKGLSSLDEKVFKYHAKDFGVIMVMFSMLPEAEYDAKGIERTNQLLEAEDFFVPEYENLGLEAVSVISIYPRGSGAPSDNAVFGYAPRYYGYKTKVDKVFGQFVGNGIFRSWSSQRSDVSATLSAQATYSMPLNLLYVNPGIFDANFNVGISVSPSCSPLYVC